MLLYNAPSSYYSMVARLALLEANVSFENRRMDIHVAKEQLSSWYRALNPNMTVPTLVDGKNVFTDSRDILRFARTKAGDTWADAESVHQPNIAKIVDAFYEIPIEDLTFGKAMIKFPLLRFVFPKILGGIVKKLRAELSACPDPDAVLAKIALNEKRIAYFTQGCLLDKLNAERHRISDFLRTLPDPSPNLFGDKTSSADVVCCVLLGRLKMAGEYGLMKSFPSLDAWFSRVEGTDNFLKADIWTKFRLSRVLLRR